jgi:hypothetical protein
MPSDRQMLDGVEHVVTTLPGAQEEPTAAPLKKPRKRKKAD